MQTKRVLFKNSKQEDLQGYIELPTNQPPHNFVLFAHCFTCNKNFFAVKNISRALAAEGYGVLRFDFTGLGESEGDFSETNFSANVDDLIEAANFLEKNHKSPALLVGHSWGGAAAIFAAGKLPSVKAVTTIGAPASIEHVEHLLKSNIDEIKEKGGATVNIGGRNFEIKEQFLKDLRSHQLSSVLKDFGKALLIMHSPQDNVVEIKNAEQLYLAARHPKSFISLDGADHLLSNSKNSLYAGAVIAQWASAYIEIPVEEEIRTEHQVVANLGREGYTTQMKAGPHNFIADEPMSFGGNNFGPTPYQFLSAGLAACTSMTIQMYARRKKWDLENVETHVNYTKQHALDCEECEDAAAKIDTFRREIVLEGDLDENQKEKLLEIANKCPVHKTLHEKATILSSLKNS